MSKGKIRDIIDSYISSQTPDEVDSAFQRWLLDDEASDEKDAALSSVWDNMSLAHSSAPEDPFKILDEAERIESTESFAKVKRMNRLMIAITVVAASLAIFAFVGWHMMGDSEVCLASAAGSKAEFLLPDGTRVWLNKGSKLSYKNDLSGDERKVKLEGEGYFDVADDLSRPFYVEAGGLSIKVLGTVFTVTAYKDESVKVFLEEGSVRASAPGHEDIILSPDQAILYDPATDSFRSYVENSADHTAWIDRRLDFVNKPLSDIIDCLEHWYGINIVCNDMNKASRIRLSMVIRQEPIEEILEAICAIAQVSYITDSKGDIKLSFEK